MEEKVALGELVAIQGQIEHLMRLILDRSSYAPQGTKSSGAPVHPLVNISKLPLGQAVQTWIATLRKRFRQPDLLASAEALATRITTHVETRNAFLHATYAHFPMHDGRPTGILFEVREDARGVPGPVMAFRAKDWDLRPVAQIKDARDEAAGIARALWELREALLWAEAH